MSYKIKHLGQGEFVVILDSGKQQEIGPNLLGMLRYTFFEDNILPEVDWEVTQLELLQVYQPKVTRDIKDGLIKPGRHVFDEVVWIDESSSKKEE